MPPISHVQLRIRDLLPQQISLREMAELLRATDAAILGAAEGGERAPGEPPQVHVSLVRIGQESTGLQFATTEPGQVNPAFRRVATAIRKHDILQLPKRSRQGVRDLQEFIAERGKVLEFRIRGRQSPLASLRGDTQLYPTVSPLIKGETEIYGVLERVGGAKPRAVLRLGDDALRFDVSEDVARKLAPYLYRWVGLVGEAEWNPLDRTYETFRIERILSYEQTPITEAVAEVARFVAPYWSDVRDVDAEVDRIRYGDDDPRSGDDEA